MAAEAAPGAPVLSDRSFYIVGLGSRCIDFGGEAWWAPGAPVIIYGCNGSVAQQVRIKEIDSASHDVELRVQNRFCLGVRGGVVVPGQPMEIQNCNGSPAQRFAIDGDALLVGAQTSGRVTREYVLEPDGGRTVARTPLVVGVRQLVDSEYFRFQAVDGSDSRPTSGFIGVTTEAQLDAALTKGWGTVIEINASFTLNGSTAKTIGAGMTLRGYRKFGDNGVQLLDGGHVPDWALFTDQDNVRITGFRMRGRADVASTPPTTAINVDSPAGSRVFVDHMDITFWNGSGVGSAGGARFETCPTPGTITDWLRQPNITIVGNFIAKNHDYGVVSSDGAFLYIQGNHMYENAHDIASDPWGSTGYAAFDNVVVSPTSGSHDFDIHGSLHPGHWFDGISGDAFEIGFNTFMPTNHPNFNDRGTPCRFVYFHDNVTPLSQADAFLTRSTDPNKTVISSNIFSSPNPISDLGVGDFDGDGVDDVFVGTGKVWYFSSSGRTEWRYLNRMPEKASQLRFGDFDNDGRTDVLALHGTTIDVSWAGVTPWQHVSSTSVPLADIAIGDFDGDHYADVFIATGTEWLFQPAAGIFGHSFQHFADSSYRVKDLRFGDFDGDHRSDVLGVVSGQWMYVPGNGNTWMPLRSSLGPMSSLVVGDFDGDGIDDVAAAATPIWRYSRSARGDWTTLRTFHGAESLLGSPIGRFDGDRKSDVLLWQDQHFYVSPGGRDPVTALSRQVMR